MFIEGETFESIDEQCCKKLRDMKEAKNRIRAEKKANGASASTGVVAPECERSWSSSSDSSSSSRQHRKKRNTEEKSRGKKRKTEEKAAATPEELAAAAEELAAAELAAEKADKVAEKEALKTEKKALQEEKRKAAGGACCNEGGQGEEGCRIGDCAEADPGHPEFAGGFG